MTFGEIITRSICAVRLRQPPWVIVDAGANCALSFSTAVQDFEVEWRRETMVDVAREGLVETPDVRRRR